ADIAEPRHNPTADWKPVRMGDETVSSHYFACETYTIERCRSQAPAGRQLLLAVPENVSELWPRHTSSPGFFLGKRMRAADTSLTRPKKHSPKSFRSPVGIVKKEPCGVHCLHGQRECIDCGSAGYGLQKFSVIAPQRSAVRCNDPGAPFSR